MSKDEYRRALDAAVREYERLTAEHAALESRIAQLKHSIAALTKLCGYEPTVPLTALEVRDRLSSIGVDLDKYSNALASIHTVLKRMHGAGELVERDRADDPTARLAYAFAANMQNAYGRFLSTKRKPGVQGLCPPKDRKK